MSAGAYCQGLGSHTKPGVPQAIVLGGALVDLLVLPYAPWLEPFLFLFESVMYYTSQHCDQDPPPLSAWTQADIQALLVGNKDPGFLSALGKLKDTIFYYAWQAYCECNTGAVQPVVVHNPAPVGVGGTGPAFVQPCATGSWSGYPPYGAGGTRADWLNLTTQILPVTSTTPIQLVTGGSAVNAYPIATNVSSLKFQAHLSHPLELSSTFPVGVGFVFWNASHVETKFFQLYGYFNDTQMDIWGEEPIPAGSVFGFAGAHYSWESQWGPAIDSTQVNISTFCGGNTSTSMASCCPPDPSLELALQHIQNTVNLILETVFVPRHVEGTYHTSLFGSGTVTLVDSIAAIRVNVTSSLDGWPANPGSPNYYFSLGFITSISVGSPLKGWRLVYGSQTFPIAQYADQVGYTLAPGVSIDLVELLPAG